jgi:hypothetical protein
MELASVYNYICIMKNMYRNCQLMIILLPTFDIIPGMSCMKTGIYLQNRLIQTSQTGGQQYSDTFPLSIPCLNYFKQDVMARKHLTWAGVFDS